MRARLAQLEEEKKKMEEHTVSGMHPVYTVLPRVTPYVDQYAVTNQGLLCRLKPKRSSRVVGSR